MWKLTDKQKALAEWIYETTGYKWKGGKPSDFVAYVNKYRPMAEKEEAERRLNHEAHLDMIDSRRDW